MSLKVEPGGSALIARFTSGSPSSFCSAFQSFALMLGMNVFGSNDGTDDHRQNVAVVWIDNDCASAADRTQRFFGD